jgi:Pyridoxamine 5'-phosphate oxidase
MNPRTLAEAIELAAKKGYVFIASADASGKTHLAAARSIFITSENQVAVSDWFCPQTMENLKSNRSLSIVAWDDANDYGFQLLGTLRKMTDLKMMNGYSPELAKNHPIPQVNRELLVEVERIIEFKIAPHSDREE